MSSTLTSAMFPAYFHAIHMHSPFPWQKHLLRQVLSDGWPDVMALPTAAGKTAIMDVAVFALACQAALPAERRIAPRRIALVVDRRIVVDDTYARAQKIRSALLNPVPKVLRQVADALSSLGGEYPLDATLLRGGIYREDRWARTPAQPVILCSTVDQVGSRLLYRGYGLSSRIWPIHAGLLGNDALIVLDEAHCSRPFLQTLTWIKRYRAVAEKPIPAPFAVVAMTATPQQGGSRFELQGEDIEDKTLGQRLKVSKLVRMVASPKAGDDAFVSACVAQLRGKLKTPGLASPGATTLVVLNRVGAARALRERLRKMAAPDAGPGEHWEHEAILLTGRCRPVERDALIKRYRARLMAGRKRDNADQKPLIVVATQCVEVGADLDADTLLSEACPLDAFRQRLGRLDRLGEYKNSRAVCLIRSEFCGEKASDPIYGIAAAKTWNWLRKHANQSGELDCGTNALSEFIPRDEEALAELCTPTTDAPVIFPAYCDLWCQTGPTPAASPSPAIFLHGPQTGESDVRVVWRADLDHDKPETWADTVALCPPVAGEALPLPIWQFRAWLVNSGIVSGDADIEGLPSDEVVSKNSCRSILRWRGMDLRQSVIINDPRAIRPGDLLVVPAIYGGCDEEGWNPDAKYTRDLADDARAAARRPPVMRIHLALLDELGTVGKLLESLAKPGVLAPSEDDPEDKADINERVKRLLDALTGHPDLPGRLAAMAQALGKDVSRRVEMHPSGTGVIVAGSSPDGAECENFTDEDDSSILARHGAVLLSDHHADVARIIGHFTVGLPTQLRDDLALAARLHDLGKADSRFQVWLHGGNRLRALRGGLLAKSHSIRNTPESVAQARRASGYPEGGRHEFLSVRMAESCEDIMSQAHDRDLFLYLIAAHHGHCRPFATVVEDDQPADVACDYLGRHFQANSATGIEKLDSGVAERFWRLIRRYGWWGLAYLEAALRLADHRASEAPSCIQE